MGAGAALGTARRAPTSTALWDGVSSEPLQTLSGLSLAIGAMIAETVETDYGAALALKWPNDLFHDDRKLGGILVEMVGEDSGRQRVIWESDSMSICHG